MRKIVLISLLCMAVFVLAMTTFAFAEEKVIIKRGDDSKEMKVDVIEKKGAYIGIFMEKLDKESIEKLNYPKSSGVLIMEVIEDSPAEKAGFESKDIIYEFDGTKLEDQEHLLELLVEKSSGETVDVVLYRDGDKKEYKLELGEQAKQYYTISVDDEYIDIGDEIGKRVARMKFDICKDKFDLSGKIPRAHVSGYRNDCLWISGDRLFLGVRVQELNSDLGEYFSLDGKDGVLVVEVFEDSAAEKEGIKSGDVIVKVEDADISDPEELIESLSDVDDEVEEISVTVIRKGKKKTFAFNTEEMRSNKNEYFLQGDMENMRDSFKHLKVKVFDDEKEGFKVLKKEHLIESKELEVLKAELEIMKERLKKLEKEQD